MNTTQKLPAYIDPIIDQFSIHQPRGGAKGTVARRVLKKKLHKSMESFLTEVDMYVEEREIGLLYADGTPIKLGDTVDVPYITPMGDLTDEVDEEKRAVVVFEHGLYGLKYPFHTTPLRDYCRKSKGKYESNYGEPIIFSDKTILVKALRQQVKERP